MNEQQGIGSRGVNPKLYAAHPPVLRPRDATWWRNPAKELAKLASAGIVAVPARGHYVVVPPARLGDTSWRPTLEGFALALAQRIAGEQHAALMGASAARVHGALPRAVGAAVVAGGCQRPTVLPTAWGDVHWVRRTVADLDVVRTVTDMVSGWVTTVEQTLLDLADRPRRGGLDEQTVSEAVIALAPGADWDLLAHLARSQRRRGAFARARWVADAVIDPAAPRLPVPAHRDRYAAPLGLRPPLPPTPNHSGSHPRPAADTRRTTAAVDLDLMVVGDLPEVAAAWVAWPPCGALGRAGPRRGRSSTCCSRPPVPSPRSSPKAERLVELIMRRGAGRGRDLVDEWHEPLATS